MFNIFKKKKEVTHINNIDLSKITTISQCRDLIIILHQTQSVTKTPTIMKVNDRALNDFPSLNKLKL